LYCFVYLFLFFKDKIVEEYRAALEKGENFYKTIKGLQYADMCVKETLRLYPVAPLIARNIKEDVSLPSKCSVKPIYVSYEVYKSRRREMEKNNIAFA